MFGLLASRTIRASLSSALSVALLPSRACNRAASLVRATVATPSCPSPPPCANAKHASAARLARRGFSSCRVGSRATSRARMPTAERRELFLASSSGSKSPPLSMPNAAPQLLAGDAASRAGLHVASGASFLSARREVAVIGAPISLGQPLHGVDQGPQMMREAGLFDIIENIGWSVHNYGDIDVNITEAGNDDSPKAKNAVAVGTANRLLAEATHKVSKDGMFAVTIGGDHSIAIGSIAGILRTRPQTGIIWVDAHADLNSPQTTYSGNIHGMSVAFLMKLHNCAQTKGFEWMHDVPLLTPDKIVYVGLRDVDPPERLLIRQLGIKAFTMQDVDRYGIGEVMRMAVAHLPDVPLHLSIDIDSVDPHLASATGTKVRGGLTFREAHYTCEAVAETKRLGSLDMVEVNPLLRSDTDDGTIETAVGMVESALGARIL